jgi:hypothetical protein
MNPTNTKSPLVAAALALLFGLSTARSADILVPGFLKFEVYTNIIGTAVADLTAAPDYPGSPGRVFYMPSFDTRTVYPNDSHDNYGGRLSGFITPTEDADYEFFLRSDDASELWLSTDDTTANLVKIAEETACCGPFEEPGAPETSFARPLLAGQRYAIQVLYKEGTGGDLAQVAWRKDGDTTPAAQLSTTPIAFLSAMIPARGSVAITGQPAGATAGANEYITLNVAFTASHAPAVVQWQRDGKNVPGLTGGTARLGPLKTSDAGRYRAVVSIPGAVATSAEVVINVNPDVTPPAIRSVVGSPTFDSITVEFTEAITPESAGEIFNYGIESDLLTIGGVTVLSPTTVRLATSQQTAGASYTLIITAIEDLAGITSTPGSSRMFTALDRVGGGLLFQTWLGIGGNAVSALTGDPRYPASPDVSAYITRFTSRQVYADAASVDNYGGRLSGWIVPTETADYHFFIRSDDNSQLSLSTDADPANAVIVATESGCCGPFEEPGAPETSAVVSLAAGQRYYIEALWKEGGGGDYCDVAWRRVGDPTLAINLPILSGNLLESYAAPGTFTPPAVAFTRPANGATFDAGEVVTLSVSAAAAQSKTITKVEILQQGRVIATVSNAPYALDFYELREDNHIFIARATDSAGLSTDSAPLTISVGVPVERLTLAAIDATTQWRYDRTGRDLGTDWRQPGYDDSTWPLGTTLIADEGTATVEPIRTRISRLNDQGQYVRTFYFRTHFNFDRPITPIVKLRLRHVVDDAVLFYLNGQEIHRFGIAAGVVVDYLTDAAGHENAYEGPYDIPLDYLVEGDNVLAAEVHQAGGSSSDMVFGGELIATVPVIRTVMTITRDGASVRISWAPSGGTLQSASSPSGPWSTVTGATSPHTAAASGPATFYRVAR